MAGQGDDCQRRQHIALAHIGLAGPQPREHLAWPAQRRQPGQCIAGHWRPVPRREDVYDMSANKGIEGVQFAVMAGGLRWSYPLPRTDAPWHP